MATDFITVNEGTAARILTDLAGTVEVGVVKLDISTAGTYGSLWSGNVGVSSGTINSLPPVTGTVNFGAGTINSVGTVNTIGTLPNIPGGTITRVQTLGTLEVGTIVSIPNTPGGTLGLITRVGNLGTVESGTINRIEGGTLGLVTRVGNVGTIESGTITVNNIPGGTITRISTIGTLEVGTISSLPNVPGGTINNSGTTTGVGTVTNVGSVTNLGQLYNAGTVQNQLAGTMTALQNGTIATGTINTGTINAGTFTLNSLSGVVLTTAVNIGTTAGTAAMPTTALANRKAFIGYNVGTSIVYIGGSGVGTASGIPVGLGQYTPAMDIGTTVLFGIAATPGGTMIALEIS